MKTFLLAALSVIVLGGCASDLASHAPANSVPPARRFDPALLHPSGQRSCALTIFREAGVRSPALNFYLDENRVARLETGEMIIFFVLPGEHHLGLRPPSSPRVEKLLTLKKGDEIAVRIIGHNGNYEFRVAEPARQKSIGSTFQSQVWDPLSRRVSASSRNRR